MSHHGRSLIIVTGGSSKSSSENATSQRLARNGASVVTDYPRDSAAVDEMVKAIGADQAWALMADIGSVEGSQKLVRAAVERLGMVSVVIPDAGIMRLETVETTTDVGLDQIFALDAKGPTFWLRYLYIVYVCWPTDIRTLPTDIHLAVANRRRRKQSLTWLLVGASFSSARS